MEVHNHPKNRIKKLLFSIILNLIITLTEFIGGIVSGSLSLISDAGHNFSDVISLILGYVGERLSLKKPDYYNTFGYKRVKVLTALINSITLVVLGLIIIFESIKRIDNHQLSSISIMVIIGIIGFIGNFISIILLHSDKEHNLNIKAAYLHLFYDTISSVIVVLSGILIDLTGNFIFDIFASIIISLMMVYSGYKIVKKTIHIFLGGVPEGIDIIKLVNDIKLMEGIINLHSLHIWSINTEEVFLSAHLAIEENIESDKILKDVNDYLKKEYNITHTVFQIEKNKICDNDEILCDK